jgi:hypothetical protein
MNGRRWGVLVICLLIVGLGSACEQEEMATAPPAESSTTATEPATEAQPPATAEAPPATEQQPATAEGREPARPADEFIGQAPAHGPETITLTAKNGNVTLPHAQHAAMIDCGTCHGEGPPGAIEFDRESAHALCIGCHQERGAGPVKCAECHVRK